MDTSKPRLTPELARDIITKDKRYIGLHEQSVKALCNAEYSQQAIRRRIASRNRELR